MADAASLKIRAKAASEAKGFYKDQKDLELLSKSAEEPKSSLKTFSKTTSNELNNSSNKSKTSDGTVNLKDKLEYLRELLDSGLITKAEYDKKRFKLLDQI